MTVHQHMWFLAPCAVSFLLGGCAPPSGTSGVAPEQLTSYRSRILLDDEPAAALGILELRGRMEGTEETETPDAHEHSADSDVHVKAGDLQRADLPDEVPASEQSGQETSPAPPEEPGAPSTSDEHDGARHDADVHEDSTVTESSPALEFLPDVTVVGKIAAQAAEQGVSASDFPWERGVAAFVIVDPAAEGETAEHEHAEGEECPFCAKKKIQAQAIVQFHNERQAPIKVDARDLFGLKLDDIVVVHGDARLMAGVLIIDADKLYIRR